MILELFGPVNSDDPANVAHLPTAYNSALATTRMWRVKPGARFQIFFDAIGTHAGISLELTWAPGVDLSAYTPGTAPATAKDLVTAWTPVVTTDANWATATTPALNGVGAEVTLATGLVGKYIYDSSLTGGAASSTANGLILQVPRSCIWMRSRIKKASTSPTALRVAFMSEDFRS